MARVLSRSNRPIIIQEPQSGLDTFLTEIAKYASPEYQQQRKANERADARFELDKQNSIQNRNYRQQQMEMSKAQESDRLIQVKQQREDKKYKEILDEVNLLYPSKPTIESLNTVESYIDKNIFSSKAYQPLKARIKNDINVITTKNKKLDSLGKELYGEDYDESKRDIIESQGSNMLKNKISQDMYGVVPDNIKMQYSQDVDGLTQALEFALQTLDAEERNERITDTLKPAYDAFLNKYDAQEFDLPAIEGYIKGVIPDYVGRVEAVDLGDDDILDGIEGGSAGGDEEVEEDSSVGTYASLVSESVPKIGKKRNKELDNLVISSLVDEESGKLGFLEAAAGEQSVLKPAGTNIRMAVKSVRNNLNKAKVGLDSQYAYGKDKLLKYPQLKIKEKREEATNNLKKSLLDAINLYKSIDPNIGRKSKRKNKIRGGESERKVIKKAINDLKAKTKKGAPLRGGINYLPKELLDFINNINLDSDVDTRVLVDYNKEQNPTMMAEDKSNFLSDVLNLNTTARPKDAPVDIPDWMFETATDSTGVR